MGDNGGSFVTVRRITKGPDRGGGYYSTHEVVAGSTAWIGKGFSCVCAQGIDSDARLSFDLTPCQETLRALWYAAYPGVKLHGLISEQWKEMGWQGKDPSTDFRGGGFISLENLLFFARRYPKSFQDLLQKQEGNRALCEYPFAVAGVNVTFMLIQMLDLQVENDRAFDILYCIAFKLMDQQWLAMHASYMDFNTVMKSTRRQLEQELLRENVSRVEDLPSYQLLNR
ncbi:ELMO CED-12 family protein [Musa troglodytarum]|uniref:ELMO CED-12 family protein n=1 Tax=Musa troglodytarum TaxID=320322 RepID=A0A9E7JFL5_9LILI|nr:ELMO CED-12 family protein [Musa troglodytarum]